MSWKRTPTKSLAPPGSQLLLTPEAAKSAASCVCVCEEGVNASHWPALQALQGPWRKHPRLSHTAHPCFRRGIMGPGESRQR